MKKITLPMDLMMALVQSPHSHPSMDMVIMDQFFPSIWGQSQIHQLLLHPVISEKPDTEKLSVSFLSTDDDEFEVAFSRIKYLLGLRNVTNVLLQMKIDSPTYGPSSDIKHAVAGYYDLNQNRLVYQDPHGYEMPGYLEEGFRANFPNIEIDNLRLFQQKDLASLQRDFYSCTYISNYNLFCFAQCIQPDEDVDLRQLRWVMHALMDECSQKEGGHVKEPQRKKFLHARRRQLWLDSKSEEVLGVDV